MLPCSQFYFDAYFCLLGISITNTVPLTNIDHDEIKAVLAEYRISNADVAIREPNCTADDIVDVVEGNVYVFFQKI